MSKQGVVVITGVSSGIGRAIAQELSSHGARVFGTVRSAKTEVPEGVEKIVLDVCDPQSIEAGVAAILERAGRIDALVNNAGASLLGSIEETDVTQAQALFDVNFFGAVRMTQAVLPAMRAQRSGRVVFVSSLVGFLPAPFMGFYSASKHALEGYAESLDHEIRGFGVRAILVEPGFMKTSIDSNAARAARVIDEYSGAREKVEAGINASVAKGEDPSVVGKVVRDVLRAPRPRLRYTVGKGAGTLATLRDLMPASMFDRALRKEFRLDS